jgi:hypothetical protein
MEDNIYLTYPLVLVDPDLEHDPEARRNEIGIITSSADASRENFNVGFQDNTRSVLASVNLFVLKPMEEMERTLLDHGAEMAFPDLKALTHLVLTLRHGIGDRICDALKIAANNPSIHPLCLETLQNTMYIPLAHNLKR